MGQPESPSIDPNNGFCPETGVFHSLRLPVPLPPESTPLSAAAYALSLQSTSPWPDSTALVDCATGHRLSYSHLRLYVDVLSTSLRMEIGLSRNDVAFVLCPNSIRVPILYFALLSIGVAVSPANPLSTTSEISRQLRISKPVVAFATSATADKLAKHGCKTILIDSAEFEHMMTRRTAAELGAVEVSQDDVAAILFSSGTTGQVKGVALTHRNFIASTANFYYQRPERSSPVVELYTVPYFHVFGYHYCLKSVALAETVVVIGRFELPKMLKAVEEHEVTHLAVVPPIVVAMVKSDLTQKYRLGSLEAVRCGAAPLGVDLIEAFTNKFKGIYLYQGYGLTETCGSTFRATNPEEYAKWGAVGKMSGTNEAKIVDLERGIALPPGKQGELWVRGPTVMKGNRFNNYPTNDACMVYFMSSGSINYIVVGYVDDPIPRTNSEALVSDGWLRTGDVCYIDEQGFLFVVDRVKEMIKYKAYQVAPAELEQLLLSHPDIVDAAVIPYSDEEAGEVPLAFVVRAPCSNLQERQVINFIARQVAPHKKIRRVAFISSIPKSPSGKILRKELKINSLPQSKL